MRAVAGAPGRLSSAQLERELRRQSGDIAATIRALGASEGLVRYALRREPYLAELARALRVQRRIAVARETREALIRHRGNVNQAARALGICHSSMTARMAKLGLDELAEWLRPKPPTAAEERRRILDAIRRHHGQLVLVSRDLRISKGTLTARLKKHNLGAEAEARRIEANRIGPRRLLGSRWNAEKRRAELRAILRSSGWNVARASRVARVSVGTMYNRMRELGIDRRVELGEEWFHRLVDALRMCDGYLERAARWLGVNEMTVRRWVRELDIEPREFRRYRPGLE